MGKGSITIAAMVTAFIVAALILAGCAGGSEVSKSGTDSSTQSPSGEVASVPQPKATEPAPGLDSLRTPPTPAARELAVSVPAGIVLQHGELSVSGIGFQPGEEVAISARLSGSESESLIARVIADERGALSDSIVVPVPDWLVSGMHTLIAKGERSGREVETPLYVRSDKLWIEVGNYGVRPTDKLGFVAGGFQPGETIAVFLQGLADSPLAELAADRAGNIPWTEVNVPVTQGGEKTLTLRGESSTSEVSAVISVVPLTPWIELIPYAGLPGSQVKLHGRGFVPGEMITVTFGRYDQLTSTIAADEYGNFFDQALVTVPMEARGGPLEVKAAGETSNTVVTQSFSVIPLAPWVGFDVYAGPPGTTIRFRGLGFAAGERVAIHMSDREADPLASGVTDKDGAFGWVGMVTIPNNTTRDVTFYAVGESSHAEASATFSVIIIPTPVPPVPIPPPPVP